MNWDLRVGSCRYMNRIPFELHVALRYLLAKRKQAFISVISMISTLGVTVGVMALVIALALMTGLQQELRDRILGSNPHVYVWKTSGIDRLPRRGRQAARRFPDVIGAAPAILGQGAHLGGARYAAVHQLKGIDPALEPQVTDIKRRDAQRQHRGARRPPTRTAGRHPAWQRPGRASSASRVGDTVSLLTPQGTLTPMGMMPRTRRLRVAGIFSLGLFEFDSTYGYVSLDVAKRLFGKDQVDLIQLRVDDISRTRREVAGTILDTLGTDYLAQDWAEMNRSLFSALWLEKIAVSLAIGLIVMVAALNIVASLILLVMEKNRDIAILKTMGASARSVTIIFMMQGLIIGIVGTAVGAAAGYAVVVGARSLPADSRPDGRLSGVARAVQGAAARLRAGRRRRPWSSASSRRSIRRARPRSSIRRRRCGTNRGYGISLRVTQA